MVDEEIENKPERVTLDQQVAGYWDREASRFDLLAKQAMFGWIARGYARRAQRARRMAESSRAREASRHRSQQAS